MTLLRANFPSQASIKEGLGAFEVALKAGIFAI